MCLVFPLKNNCKPNHWNSYKSDKSRFGSACTQKTSRNRELFSDHYGTESGTTALCHKQTSRKKSRWCAFLMGSCTFFAVRFVPQKCIPADSCGEHGFSGFALDEPVCQKFCILVGPLHHAKYLAPICTETPWRKNALWIMLGRIFFRFAQNLFLRVIPTLAHYSDIVSDMPSMFIWSCSGPAGNTAI